jgi:hypothetical protein
VNAISPSVAFYDIHGRKGEVLFYSSALDITRGGILLYYFYVIVNLRQKICHEYRTLRIEVTAYSFIMSASFYTDIFSSKAGPTSIRLIARHATHFPFDISVNALEIRTIQSLECIV